jgi:hypothetical protein
VIALFPLAETDSGTALFSGLIFVGLLLVGLVWLFFPFIVNSKMNELIREIRGLRKDLKDQGTIGNEHLEKIATRTGRISPVAGENVQRPTSNVQQRPMEDPPSRKAMAGEEPEVYRID